MRKSTCKLFIPLLTLFFIIIGCNFIKDGKAKLAHYCPGLKINISGMSYAYSSGKTFYVISYEPSSQGTIKSYFENKENGFAEINDSKLYDMKVDDESVIDKSDNFVGKAFKDVKGNAEIIFNETTRRIIIIED
jgi:hypothetical protein